MTIQKSRSGTIIGCSVLMNEIELLRQEFWPEWSAEYLPSMLHINPEILAEKLDDLIHQRIPEERNVILVYGDCCHSMALLEKEPGIARTPGVNCIELVLGKEEYKTLIREGVFFLLPEWSARWHTIFSQELGLSQSNAQELMNEMHARMVYLDTGIIQVPIGDIEECSRYCGLPCEIHSVSLIHLKSGIETAMNRLEGDPPHT